MKKFGQMIREARHQNGWTLQQLADKACTYKGFLSGVENGVHRAPSAGYVRRLSRALGLPTDYMIALAYWERRDKAVTLTAMNALLEDLEREEKARRGNRLVCTLGRRWR